MENCTVSTPKILIEKKKREKLRRRCVEARIFEAMQRTLYVAPKKRCWNTEVIHPLLPCLVKLLLRAGFSISDLLLPRPS